MKGAISLLWSVEFGGSLWEVMRFCFDYVCLVFCGCFLFVFLCLLLVLSFFLKAFYVFCDSFVCGCR